PSLYRSAVLCRGVRDGQVCDRKKMIRTTLAKMSAIRANARGHQRLYSFPELSIGCSPFGVERLSSTRQSSKTLITSKNEEEGVCPPKKLPPPTPDGREGRLFPPEQS